MRTRAVFRHGFSVLVLGAALVGCHGRASIDDGSPSIPRGPWASFRLRVELAIDESEVSGNGPGKRAPLVIGFGAPDEGGHSSHQLRIEQGSGATLRASFVGPLRGKRSDSGRWARAGSAAFNGPTASHGLPLQLEVARGRVRFFADGSLLIDSPLGRDIDPGNVTFEDQNARLSFSSPVVEELLAEEIANLSIEFGALRPVRTIAHRGASSEYPENTLVAIRGGIEGGADAVEFDVYRSKDGEVVLFHDRDLHRTTNVRDVFAGRGKSKIADLTFDELRTLDAGSWKSPKFRGERVPSLREALEALRGQATALIEIKPDGISRDVARVVRDAKMESEVVAQSFSAEAVRIFHEELPGVATAYLTGARVSSSSVERARAHVRTAREAHANAIGVNFQLVTPEYLAEIHRHAMSVWVWTVNERAAMEALVRIGVDGIITDRPVVLRELLGLPVPGRDQRSDQQEETAVSPPGRRGG